MATKIPRAAYAGAQVFLQRHLKLRQLRLLVALDHHRHVGKVAQALHLTQPAVSKSLAELEHGLGIALFTRTAHGLLPTAEGVCLIRHAQAVNEDLRRAALSLEAIGRADVWRLAVGAMYGTPPLVTKAFQLLQQRRPAGWTFELTVHEGAVDSLLALLRASQLDIVVGTAPERSACADLEVTPLYSEPMVWVAAPDHPLSHRSGLSLQDLVDWTWVLPPRTARVRTVIDAMFRKHRVAPAAQLVETLSFQVLLAAVLDRRAVALSSRCVALDAASRGLVAALNVHNEGLMLHVSAMTLLEAAPSACAAELLTELAYAAAL